MIKKFSLFIIGLLILGGFSLVSYLNKDPDGTMRTPIKEVLQATAPTQSSSIDIAKYTQAPYNLPTPGEPILPSDAQAALGNTVSGYVNQYQSYLTSKYDPKYVDPFLSAIWTVAIEGISSPYFWNCLDTSKTNDPSNPAPINAGCHDTTDADGNLIVAFNSGNWQVGYGIQVSQAASHIAEDFNAVYGEGKADDPSFVQSIGQAIINQAGITNPATFPSQTVTSLVTQAGNPGSAETASNIPARQALAILLMDPKLGAVAVAREIAGDIASNDNWRATMEGWAPSYRQNMQTFSNRMAGMAEKYTGVAAGGSSGISGSIPPITLRVRLKDGTEDTYIINRATANAIGGNGGSTNNSGATGLPGQPLPEGGVEEIASKLCTDYNVCATVNTHSIPDQAWSMAQITALWNVIQKIQKSSTYKAYAIGNAPLEISRAKYYPLSENSNDGTWGYFAGDNDAWQTIKDVPARLVIATDNVPKDAPNDKLEWLFAHEIGHGASGGNSSGDIPADCLACNETATKLIACKTPISVFAETNDQEYVAEAISYYMTNAEAVNDGYKGRPGGNMKQDFPCLYNALKDGYFNGVEY